MLDVAIDVLDHDDGVVDDEADGDGERHQRQIVEAEKFIRYIAANEPASASGTVTLGMSVAQKLRRNKRITITTRQMVSTSVNSTSATEARMVTVRSRMVSTLTAGGMRAVSCGSSALIVVDDVDDVGAGLLEDREDDAVLVVLIGGDGAVDGCGNRLADVAHPDRGAVAVGDHDVVEFVGVGDLVVGGDREGDLVAVDHALGGIGGRS